MNKTLCPLNKRLSGHVQLLLRRAFKRKQLCLAVLLFLSGAFPIFTHAQDSSHIRVSLITCGPGGPGDELYTTFGHTGIRVIDSSSVTDYVFNYGNFDAFEDNFYLNFIKGRLRYFISVDYFNEFEESYRASNRGITEQVLQLTAAEKINVQQFLRNNILPQNRYYMYEFCFDNCTTRVRDLIKKNHDSTFVQTAVMPLGSTFRNAIHFCLNRNDQQWSKLGIDLLLGKPCDAVMTTEQMDFLPENLMNSLAKAKHPFVSEEKNIYTAKKAGGYHAFFSPVMVFSLLLIIIVGLSFVKHKAAIFFIEGFDRIFFFFIGLLGILLVFMWVGTDHLMTKNNFNLLWAWPTHAIAAFFFSSRKKGIKNYYALTSAGMIIVLAAWHFLPQQMNNSLLPLVLLLLYRSYARYQSLKM